MRFLGIIAGIIFGLSIEDHDILLAIFGGFIGLFVVEVLLLNRKVAGLEKRLKPEIPSTATVQSLKTVVAPPVDQTADIPKSKPLPAAPKEIKQKPPSTATASYDSPSLPAFIQDFLAGKNTAVITGVFILFIGLVFLFKYAIEHSLIPIEVRLIFAGLVACVMLFFGWRLRIKRTNYALILQGGGVGILYLTIFVAFRFYKLIPSGPAFLFLFLVMVFSMSLAVLQNSRTLAVLATTGGFLAPILTSTNEGNYIALFSYYAVINTGILAVSLYRSWRILNLVGFVFTFGVGAIWGTLKYAPEYLVICEGFLILFFFMYSIISVLFSLKQPPNLKGIVDGTLVFALPLAFIGMQFYLVHEHKYHMAYSSLGLGMYYLGLTSFLFRRVGKGIKTLLEAFIALGVIFSSLAIPLAFDAPATSVFWAFEGAGLTWIGLKQNRLSTRIFGFILQGGSWFYFLRGITFETPVQFFNGQFIGFVILFIASLFAAFLYRKKVGEKTPAGFEFYEIELSRMFTLAAVVWWFWGGFYQLQYVVPGLYYINVLAAFIGGSILAFFLAGRKWAWLDLQRLIYFLLPVLYIHFFAQYLDRQTHPFQNAGFLAWSLNFVILYGILYLENPSKKIPIVVMHLGGLFLLNLVITVELYWQVIDWFEVSTLWSDWTLALPSMAVLYFISGTSILNKKRCIPYREFYLAFCGTLLFFYGVLFAIGINVASDGNPAPLPYVTLFNPTDIFSLIIVFMAIRWMKFAKTEFAGLPKIPFQESYVYVIGGLIFIWVNMTLARNIHFLGNIPWDGSDMFNSMLVQMIYSIFWATIGLVFMVVGNRAFSRNVWLFGAAFMGLVVVKLFLIDLSNTATLFRIASFVVVGIILLIIGYLAPVPHAVSHAVSRAFSRDKNE